MPYIQNTLAFAIDTVLGLYLIVVLLRFVFQQCRADHRNPLSVAIIRLTDAPLRVFRRMVPGLFGIDMACLILALAVSMLQIALIMTVSGYPPDIPAIAVLALNDVLKTVIWILIIAILAAAIMSWFMRSYHPVLHLAVQISEPVLRPFRSLLPAVGGLDLSPLLALFALNLLLRLIVAPIGDFGRYLTYG